MKNYCLRIKDTVKSEETTYDDYVEALTAYYKAEEEGRKVKLLIRVRSLWLAHDFHESIKDEILRK